MKKTIILVLFAISLIQFSHVVQAQESLQQEVQREKMLEEQASQSVQASQQQINQVQQPIYQQIQSNWEEQQERNKRLAIMRNALESQPQLTTSEINKSKQDWAVYKVFAFSLLTLSIGLLVFILLLHIPNRLISPEHFQDVPLVVAVRRGMTQANFNASNSKVLIGEIIVISIIAGMLLKSFLVLGIAFLGFIVLLSVRTTAFIIIYIFSVFWMLVAAQCGYLICGGQFLTPNSYIYAWVGGLVFAIIGFVCAAGVHFSGLQYYEDING